MKRDESQPIVGNGIREYTSPNECQVVTSIFKLDKLLPSLYPEHTQHKDSIKQAVKKRTQKDFG